jgi:hypothetical protein
MLGDMASVIAVLRRECEGIKDPVVKRDYAQDSVKLDRKFIKSAEEKKL